ncbi:hypothetical protein [Ralstonia pickettii]|uniref:hypothetical protein n=1 Tax=Ralstonia pickettii TaxID=329 RepID=UPI002D78DB62|nr:hypothetical protein [Ralstonia pickettii]
MSKELNVKIIDAAMNQNWRFETLLHIGGMTGDDALPGALRDALEDAIDEIAVAVGLSAKQAREIDEEELLERMRHKRQFGFLVQVATPVREYLGDGDTYACSWGHYRTRWFYTEDIGALLKDIEDWVEQCCNQDRTKVDAVAA